MSIRKKRLLLFVVGFIILGVGLIASLVILQQRQTISSLAAPGDDFSRSTVVSGLSNPTAMAFAPDGRLFIAEQGGKVKIVKNGSTSTFTTFSVDSSGERGLLGIAFDPNFSSNKYVYF